MDRLKYRVWDKINEVWIEGPFLDVRKGCIAGYYMPEEAMKRRIVVEQCTGLKDKNGKLIYENDIVKAPHSYKYEIKWSDGGWGLFFRNGQYDIGLCERASKEVEIIGNIHENADLLGEE